MGKETVTTGTLTQLFLGLVWLGTTMYAAHATVTGGGEDLPGALRAAVVALPGVVAATLSTGASIGASIGAAAGRRFRRAGGRLLAGLGVGALSAWSSRPASCTRTAVGRPSWPSRSPSARRALSAVPWLSCPVRC